MREKLRSRLIRWGKCGFLVEAVVTVVQAPIQVDWWSRRRLRSVDPAPRRMAYQVRPLRGMCVNLEAMGWPQACPTPTLV